VTAQGTEKGTLTREVLRRAWISVALARLPVLK